MDASQFWLGTHQPSWLAQTDVPLFISRRRLAKQKTWKPAQGPWCLDSGGFTQLSVIGHWDGLTPRTYAAEVSRYQEMIGRLAWAAPMDWMCEPNVVAKTGLTVTEHQRRTVANFIELEALIPGTFIPVIQGWTYSDYFRCVGIYDAHGIDLTGYPVVGVGSVCRRSSLESITRILRGLAALGLSLHGFGVKGPTLNTCGDVLTSTDSMAWSFDARYVPPLPGHDSPGPGRPRGHKNCANCLEYALQWRANLLTKYLEDTCGN